MSYSTVTSSDIIASLNSLKDALDVHFANILKADTLVGGSHANILKHHIDGIVAGKEALLKPAPLTEVVTEWPAALPLAVARFAPRATFNPPANLGVLGTLPLEIRGMIYEYALSPSAPGADACDCTRDARTASNGLGLLRASGQIYNEAIPFLYASDFFSIICGYINVALEHEQHGMTLVKWIDPVLCRHTNLDRVDIDCVPHNALQLIKNLKIDFVNLALQYEDKDDWDFVSCTAKFLRVIQQVCTILKYCVQLQYLEVDLSFTCTLGDIELMASLIEPIKLLRGIKEPSVTIFGFQYDRYFNEYGGEPRWHLTDEFEDYLEHLLMSPHGTPTPPSNGIKIFHDSWEMSDLDLPGCVKEKMNRDESEKAVANNDAELIPNYLRDVYGTDDLEALHGGLPDRWQIWLQSEHEDDCDWFDSNV